MVMVLYSKYHLLELGEEIPSRTLTNSTICGFSSAVRKKKGQILKPGSVDSDREASSLGSKYRVEASFYQ